MSLADYLSPNFFINVSLGFLFVTHFVVFIICCAMPGVLLTLALLPQTCCFRWGWGGKGVWLNSPFPPHGMLLLIVIDVSY